MDEQHRREIADLIEQLRALDIPRPIPQELRDAAPELSEDTITERLEALWHSEAEPLYDTCMRHLAATPDATPASVLTWWLRGCP